MWVGGPSRAAAGIIGVRGMFRAAPPQFVICAIRTRKPSARHVPTLHSVVSMRTTRVWPERSPPVRGGRGGTKEQQPAPDYKTRAIAWKFRALTVSYGL